MEKFTKIALASAISFAFTAQANAAAYTHPTIPVPTEPFFNGFYIGAGASVVGANAETTTTYKKVGEETIIVSVSEGPFYLTDFNNVHQGDHIGKYGFGAHVFVGFGQVMDTTYYLGGEVFANYFSPNMKHSFDSVLEGTYDPGEPVNIVLSYTTTTKVKNQWSYGGDIRLGYLISPQTMFYVLFGLDYSKFELESMGSITLSSEEDLVNLGLPIVNNFNKSKLGYIPGLGLETTLPNSDNLTVRAEYRHAFYSSFEKTVSGTPNPIDGATYATDDASHNMTTKVKPNRGIFSLDLSYYLK